MNKYEHKIVTIYDDNTTELRSRFDVLGNEGWRFAGNVSPCVFVFVREKPELDSTP